VFIFVNFLALRQSVTPSGLLGRMTSTMRWLILLPGAPGALIGGWLGDHVSLQATLGFSGALGIAAALIAIRMPILRDLRALPQLHGDSGDDAPAESAKLSSGFDLGAG
jgi:hypothetical protein